VADLLKPARGGFLRVFGLGWFIWKFLLGEGPHGSPRIDPLIGAPEADIFRYYKLALMQAYVWEKATAVEEKRAKREGRYIDPDRITELANRYLGRMKYKAHGCRYHSFVTYFSNLKRLGWVEESGKVEPSAFQDHYPEGQPRKYFRLTKEGREASEADWANPHRALYG
jgi:hypothetical protein